MTIPPVYRADLIRLIDRYATEKDARLFFRTVYKMDETRADNLCVSYGVYFPEKLAKDTRLID